MSSVLQAQKPYQRADHFSGGGPNQDTTIAHDGPFLRLIQPDQPTSPFTASSYLRLGRYVSQNKEEVPLTTHLKSTHSKVVPGDQAPTLSAATVTADNVNKVFSTASQVSHDHVTTQDQSYASDNDGILIYTNHDLNENIVGAALQKYGKGHVVDVLDNDAAYAVQKGKYDLFAENGLFFYAGSKENPANIEMISEANFKCVVKGNVEVQFGGNSTKKTVGTSFDHFVGMKMNLFLGLEASIKLSGSLSVSGLVDVYIRTSGKVSLTLAYDFSATAGFSKSITKGSKYDSIYGIDQKYVVGTSRKNVVGEDYKTSNGDWKLIYGDSVSMLAGTDLKIVHKNATLCDIDYKKEMASLGDAELKRLKTELTTNVDNLVVNQVRIAKVLDAKIYLFQ